jgi:hypothetical protein
MTIASDHERPGRATARMLCAVFAAVAALAAAAPATPTGEHPLETAIVDPLVFTGPDAAAALDRAAAAGATAIKVPVFWSLVAPARRPRTFRPADPSDPAYDWNGLDTELRLIHAHGLEPIVYIAAAPTWALTRFDGLMRPDPGQFAAFARAAVRRYSGHTKDLPRVRVWQAWNEPNKVANPAYKPGAADWYRSLVNAFASSVHSLPGNVVVAGGVSPFGISTAVAPLAFMRELVSAPVHFDIWSVDPYTAGGPSHLTAKADDISIAKLPAMKAVLDAGVRAGHVVSTAPVRFWVTEFAWDSNPPDPDGVPLALEGRWVADALHRMWLSGVSLVTWFSLRDQPLATSPYQSGLYLLGTSFARDRAKPALTAFRFPFVAGRTAPARISVWGRTPTSSAGKVVVEQLERSSWKQLAVLEANDVGIFSSSVDSRGAGALRALYPATGAVSLPYSLVGPPDQPYQPFGARLTTRAGPHSSSAAVSQYVENDPTAGGEAAAVGSGPGGARTAAFAALLACTALALVVAAIRRRRTRRLPGGGLPVGPG